MTTHRSDIFSNHRVRFVAARPTLALRPRARLPATIEGDAGAARSMETLLRARLDAQELLRDRHRDRLRVIDADIRRAEEEGFAADAKVVSAREVLRRLERARDDARRRHAELRSASRDGHVTTRALAERDAALRTRRRRANRPPSGATFAGGAADTSFTSSRAAAGCETPAREPPAARASARCDATRGASRRETKGADDPNPPASPSSRGHHGGAASPRSCLRATHGANTKNLTTATGGCATSLGREPSPRATRATVPREAA